MMKRTALALALSLCAATGSMAADWGCTTAGVNYRSGPATSYDRLGSLAAYTRVSIENCSSEYGAPWCKITWGGYSGWVAKRYLSYDASYCEAQYREPAYQAPARTEAYGGGY